MNTIGDLLAAKGVYIMTTERKAQAALLTSPLIKMIIMDESEPWADNSRGIIGDMEAFYRKAGV